MCEVQISLAITLMDGNHTSEATTIEIGEKKISVIGKGKDKSSIGTGALSLSSAAGALFSVTTGHIGLLHMKVDCNSNLSPSSPSVVVVSDGSGSLSLEDVITTSVSSGDYVMSSSVFVVPLSQLSMVDVEIKDMNVAKPLFSELDLSSPSSSSLSSLSSSALYLTATASGDSVLANVKVTNVKLTEGDGVVVAKSVKAGETFGMMSTRTEGEQSGCIFGKGDSEMYFWSHVKLEGGIKNHRCVAILFLFCYNSCNPHKISTITAVKHEISCFIKERKIGFICEKERKKGE
ncbi:uncharacterized protein MONOS_16686 [Monocercomonoides exilis]|nr:hypothetical protein MONOS_16686 [Monocercomonoides exilis]|eukprot:MONOS_16686.1-p1 / transcript=MONOS_16686.1 / gene=MONOS_16686 / organism=Monocercomonoides_exilis_PA203 / gene_product=unspecified product / transcript_product=unspecified product / location=Mono_scaffold02008:49-921(+) / protein_length=291 / sequence_SO=supercontig / SO=protein_coding / is_pseudo=false